MPRKHPRTPTSKLRRPLTALFAMVAGLAMLSLGLFGTAGATVPPGSGGWNLVWSDDFSGAVNTLPSSSNWIIDTGTGYPGGAANWGTGATIGQLEATVAQFRSTGQGLVPLGDIGFEHDILR